MSGSPRHPDTAACSRDREFLNGSAPFLQTADYARAIFRTRLKLSGEEIDEQVAARRRGSRTSW